MNILRITDAKEKSAVFIVADKFKICNDALAAIRKEIAKKLKLYDESEFAFSWVYDFPLFEWNSDDQNGMRCTISSRCQKRSTLIIWTDLLQILERCVHNVTILSLMASRLHQEA